MTHTSEIVQVVLHVLYILLIIIFYTLRYSSVIAVSPSCTSQFVEQIDLCPICESIVPQVQAIVDKASTEVFEFLSRSFGPCSVSCSHLGRGVHTVGDIM